MLIKKSFVCKLIKLDFMYKYSRLLCLPPLPKAAKRLQSYKKDVRFLPFSLNTLNSIKDI